MNQLYIHSESLTVSMMMLYHLYRSYVHMLIVIINCTKTFSVAPRVKDDMTYLLANSSKVIIIKANVSCED